MPILLWAAKEDRHQYLPTKAMAARLGVPFLDVRSTHVAAPNIPESLNGILAFLQKEQPISDVPVPEGGSALTPNASCESLELSWEEVREDAKLLNELCVYVEDITRAVPRSESKASLVSSVSSVNEQSAEKFKSLSESEQATVVEVLTKAQIFVFGNIAPIKAEITPVYEKLKEVCEKLHLP